MNKNRGLDRMECDINVDHLYKWALREVEVWVLRVAPRQPGETKKYDAAKREHHHICFLYHQREIFSRYIALGQFVFLQEQIKDIIISLSLSHVVLALSL